MGERVLIEWFYSSPAWLAGGLAVLVAVVLSWIGLWGAWLVMPTLYRREHNDVIGFTLAIVGVVYAVLLAFIAVVTWETFSRADEVTANEVSHLSNLYSDTSVLHGPALNKFRTHLRDYVQIVVDHEWPQQQTGRVKETFYTAGWDVLEEANSALLSFKPADLGESDVYRSALQELNALLAARMARVDAAAGHVPRMVWWIIVLGGALTVGYTFLFGMPSKIMHLLMTGGVAASLALIIVLIAELDYPFRGDISVSDGPFVHLQYRMAAEATQLPK